MMTWKEYINQTVTISFNKPDDNWIKSNWNYNPSIEIYYKETDRMVFYIYFTNYIPEINKLALDCAVFSLMLREDVLLVHGMLLNNGDVLVGEPYAGKTTLSRRLNLGDEKLKALCDDQVLIDLKNNLAYPVPYYYYDPISLFLDHKSVQFSPIPLNRVLILKKGTEDSIEECSTEEYMKTLYNCSIIWLHQPFAQRDEVLIAERGKTWISFKYGMELKMQKKIKQLIESYFIEKTKLSFTFHI